ncbi:MAG TPA: molybdopterin-dependent oxidoreductase [Spirochaetia bacterium]|nr:molybdopterin-dependent oxidoreductase [Spirochaetia bacterium]
MITVYIDNVPYEVKENQNLLQASLSLGFNLPYFCWHPALHSVGACRQCAVKLFKDENDTRGRIVMGCMTAATDGIRYSVEDPEAKGFRGNVTEWLMLNHPHDCPICDEGGECHLQDMTIMSGHNYRRTRFKKRTHLNQNLGPFLNHEMNRCIQCYRCVRFYRDYAGGRDLDVFSAHDEVYFGRFEEGPLESPFSGNLVEICPTGVFTDKTFKEHPVRKWDLQTAPSICTQCGLGCNTIAGERYGTLRRVLNRYNSSVNRYFLCDRGRYGYDFVNHPDRLREPILRTREFARVAADSDGTAGPAGPDVVDGMDGAKMLGRSLEGVVEVTNRVRAIVEGSAKVIGIGSPKASVESNYALRNFVGVENFSTGMPAREHRLNALVAKILSETCGRTVSLAEIEQADAVFVLGEDAVNVAPLLEMALRQSVRTTPDATAEAQLHIPDWDDRAVREAVQAKKGPMFVATPFAVSLDDFAVKSYRGTPDDIAILANAVAHLIDPENAPAPEHLGELERALAETIAGSLGLATKPLVVSGTSLRSESVLEAASNVLTALGKAGKDAGVFLTVAEANSLGNALLGGLDLDEVMSQVAEGEADTLIIMENDLFGRMDASKAEFLLQKAEHVIVLDYLKNRTSDLAEIVVPVATFAESTGTLVNNEGRAQRFYEIMNPDEVVKASWKWVGLFANPHYDGQIVWDSFDYVLDTIARQMPLLAPIKQIAPSAASTKGGLRVPRESHRYSGRTAMTANLSVHEPMPPQDGDSPLSYTMEGRRSNVPPALVSRLWAPHWNSVQSLTRFQEEVDGPLRGGDPGIKVIGNTDNKTTSKGSPDYFTDSEESFHTEEGKFLVLPGYHIYGSEPTSVLSKAVAGRATKGYIGLSEADAAERRLNEGDRIDITIDERSLSLPYRPITGLPKGVCVVPVGTEGVGYLAIPALGDLVGAEERGTR